MAERIDWKAKAEEVLRWYADEKNWRTTDHYSSPSQDFPYYTSPSAAQTDRGEKARAAIRTLIPE